MPANLWHNEDVLLSIFLLAIKDDPLTLRNINAVDKRCKGIVSSSPLLWSRITVKRTAHLNGSFVETFLQRSQGAPLDLKIDLPDYVPGEEANDSEFLSQLRSAVGRIKSLHLHLHDGNAIQAFISGIGDNQAAPRLQELSIIRRTSAITTTDLQEGLVCLQHCFTPAPNLRYLTLPPWSFLKLPRAMTQISTVTHLSIPSSFHSIDVVRILDVLRGAPQLEGLVFKGPDRRQWGPAANFDYSPVVDMPRLRSVDVTMPGAGADLLRNIEAPLLTFIRLDGWREDEEVHYWDEPLITEPISVTLDRTSHRSPSVRHLHLRCLRLHNPADDYHRILTGQWFSRLETLVLEDTDISDTIIEKAAGLFSGRLSRMDILGCRKMTARTMAEASSILIHIEGRPEV